MQRPFSTMWQLRAQLAWRSTCRAARDAARGCQGCYPTSLRWWSIRPMVLFCWSCGAALEYFLHRGWVERGVIFAPDVNKLPIRRSFVDQYLPAIVAVVFSIFIVWIDNDGKCFEPYRQMSLPHSRWFLSRLVSSQRNRSHERPSELHNLRKLHTCLKARGRVHAWLRTICLRHSRTE